MGSFKKCDVCREEMTAFWYVELSSDSNCKRYCAEVCYNCLPQKPKGKIAELIGVLKKYLPWGGKQ